MATRNSPMSKSLTVLLVEADVLVRHAIGEHLRACEIMVIEAASADDAKAVLLAGPVIDIILSDAQLAGEGSGFDLAQWVRRHRPAIEIILTASIASKTQAAAEITARLPVCNPSRDAAALLTHLNGMLAERKRRLRSQSKTAGAKRRRQRA